MHIAISGQMLAAIEWKLDQLTLLVKLHDTRKAAVSVWLDEHELSSVAESDWECPICFEPVGSEKLVVVCKNSEGHATHSFHRKCMDDWFVRGKDECPSCR